MKILIKLLAAWGFTVGVKDLFVCFGYRFVSLTTLILASSCCCIVSVG